MAKIQYQRSRFALLILVLYVTTEVIDDKDGDIFSHYILFISKKIITFVD